jgi:excisionase family DNA binding protein
MSLATVQSPLVYTRQEAAHAIKCSLRTLDFLLASKALKAVRIGKSVRVSINEVQRFLQEGGTTK